MTPKTNDIPPKSERPRCKGCELRLRPEFDSTTERVERPLSATEQAEAEEIHGRGAAPATAFRYKVVGRKLTGYRGYDGFHSLRCALDFASRAYDAGYRLARKP